MNQTIIHVSCTRISVQLSKVSNIVHFERMNIDNILVTVSVEIILFFIHIDQSLIYNEDIVTIVQMIIY